MKARLGVLGVAALVLAVSAMAAPASAAAKPRSISGKLSKPGYTVIALADNGKATSVRLRRSSFRLRPPASRVTLHLRARNGRYAGPVVLGSTRKGRRAILGTPGSMPGAASPASTETQSKFGSSIPRSAPKPISQLPPLSLEQSIASTAISSASAATWPPRSWPGYSTAA